MRNAVRLSGALNFTVATPLASVTAPGTHTALATNRERTVPTESPPVAGRSTFGAGMSRMYSSWVALCTPRPHGA
jgi:hypothetical protein